MQLGPLLQQVSIMAGVLCTFATLFLFGFGKLSDTQGGRGEAVMIGTAVAAVAFYGAAAFIATQDLTISV